MKAIRAPNNAYCTWPLINVKTVNRHFPKWKDTQFGHMRNQRQNVRSTKKTRFKCSPPVKEEIDTDEITVEKVNEDEEVEEKYNKNS